MAGGSRVSVIPYREPCSNLRERWNWPSLYAPKKQGYVLEEGGDQGTQARLEKPPQAPLPTPPPPAELRAGCYSTRRQGAAQAGDRTPDVDGGGVVRNEVIRSVIAEG